MTRLLFIGRDGELLSLLAEYFASQGYAVRQPESTDEALAIIGRGEADLVVAEAAGLVEQKLCQAVAKLPGVILTAMGETMPCLENCRAEKLRVPVSLTAISRSLRAVNLQAV